MSNNENDPGDFDPAQAGSELQDPNDKSTMSKQQGSQTGAQSGHKPAQAINGFGGLYPRMTDIDTATVLSLRNNGVSAYRVNISTLECEKRNGTKCEDLEYNCSNQQVCDHIAAAIYQAPRTPDVDLKALDGAVSTLSIARDAAHAAQSTADSLRAARNSHAQDTAANKQNGSQQGASSDESERDGYDLEDMKGELREKLEYAGFDVTDMGTGTYEGTDQIKFVVQHNSFDRLKQATSECDIVGYDGEMNAVDVADVERYIEEVLE